MDTALKDKIAIAFNDINRYEKLLELVENFAEQGLTRLEIYRLLLHFHSTLPQNNLECEQYEDILDRLSGWTNSNQTLLKEQPINQLAIFQWWHPSIRHDKVQDNYWNSLIHPDDLKIAEESFRTNIFFVGQTQNSYTIIKQFDKILRVKQDSLKLIKFEGFYLEDKVSIKTKEGQNSNRNGIINSIQYDYKKKQLFYTIVGQDKKKVSRRYFSDDLRMVWG
jgi:hypothetical protein